MNDGVVPVAMSGEDSGLVRFGNVDDEGFLRIGRFK